MMSPQTNVCLSVLVDILETWGNVAMVSMQLAKENVNLITPL